MNRTARLPHATAAATTVGRWLLVLVLAWPAACAADGEAADGLPRDPLELRALIAPQEVLEALPERLAAARAAHDWRQLALLHLAEANACRVIADWACQRRAAAAARQAADQANDGILQVRATILRSRAAMAMQDHIRAEQLLAEGRQLLQLSPSSELAADVDLAFSSLSHVIGKHALAAEYAERGLQALAPGQAPPMRARLERNRARALAHLGRFQEAQAALDAGIAAAQAVDDPKLLAELALESARLAHRRGDLPTQRRQVEVVLGLAERVRNTQLFGQAQEALGLFHQQAGDPDAARQAFAAAYDSFHSLGLERDELRALQTLIGVLLERGADSAALRPLLRRYFELQEQVVNHDRAQAAGDFDTRLRLVEQQVELARLEGEAQLSSERSGALAARQRQSQRMTALSLAMLAVLGVFYVLQRRANHRLQLALSDLRRSESRAAELLRLTTGMVFLHRLDGRIDLLNPAAAQAFGIPAGASQGHLQDLVEEPANGDIDAYLEALGAHGSARQVLRVTSPEGTRVLRIEGRLAGDTPTQPYVIGHAVDITAEQQGADALREQVLQDPLTGCFNRRHLDRVAAGMEAEAAWGVVNIDLDGFKAINDLHGHDHGDRVLREMVAFLGRRLREDDQLVRAGGDEFLILMPEANASMLTALVTRLRADRALAPCAYSLGSALRLAGEPLAETLARADADMYTQRRTARGTA